MSEQEIRAQWLGKRVRTASGVVGVVDSVEVDLCLHITRQIPATHYAAAEDCELLDASPAPSETDERVAVNLPYVGAVVLYHLSGIDYAAIITRTERLSVGLAVFDRDVISKVSAEYGAKDSCWSWPVIPPPVYLKKEKATL